MKYESGCILVMVERRTQSGTPSLLLLPVPLDARTFCASLIPGVLPDLTNSCCFVNQCQQQSVCEYTQNMVGDVRCRSRRDKCFACRSGHRLASRARIAFGPTTCSCMPKMISRISHQYSRVLGVAPACKCSLKLYVKSQFEVRCKIRDCSAI